MSDNNIVINHNGNILNLKNALIAGYENNLISSPTTIYCGSLNLDVIHTNLFYINRAIIKLLVSEFNFPLNEVDDFIFSAVSEALVKEQNSIALNEPDMDVIKVVKKYPNSQN